ncbi:MAG: four helix bundle protein [Alphaproteobacteria bacterium]|nr:four helix bundle protein [Alphaproteobacteria bacterium]
MTVDSGQEKKRSAISSYEDFTVFERAYQISLAIHKFSLTLPKIETFALADQIRRASKSICANIAEGYGKQKQSPAEFKRFLNIAIGSSDEMRVWVRYCRDLGYLENTLYEEWRAEYQSISRMLQSLVNKLK